MEPRISGSIFIPMFSIENIETALPGVIVAVNDDGTVDCKPCIRKVAPNGVFDIVNPAIPKIPVMRLGGSYAEFSFPVKKGDQVLLLGISRDSEQWKLTGKDDVVPESSSGLTLNDFVAVPFVAQHAPRGAVKFTIGDDGSVNIQNGHGSVQMADDGTVTINGHLEVKP